MDSGQSTASAEPQTRKWITPVNGLLLIIAALLAVIVGLLLQDSKGSPDTAALPSGGATAGGSTQTAQATESITEGGFTYRTPVQAVTVRWGKRAAFPDGLTVRASRIQVADGSSDGEKTFRYRVKFSNRGSETLNTAAATYRMFAVQPDGGRMPCSKVTGPPDMMPPEAVLSPGQSITGWIGAGCPGSTKANSKFVLEMAEHPDLPVGIRWGG